MQYRTGQDLVDDARLRIKEVRAAEVRDILGKGADVVVLDVREPNEWNLGRVPRAIHLPRGHLEGKVEAMLGRDKQVIVYCSSGSRSALAADTLQQMGYANVMSMSDGFSGWVAADGEVEG